MAKENSLVTRTFTAAADLSAKQFYAVTNGASGIDVSTAAKNTDGILQNKPTAGVAGSVAKSGITKAAITASANVSVGSLLEVDTGGTLKVVASGTPVAKALEASNVAAIVLLTVELLPSNDVFA